MRKTLGKKGFITDFMADLFSFFFYVLCLLVFMLLFSLSFAGCNNLTPSNSKIISGANEGLGQGMLFLNYLKTSTISAGESMTYAELVGQACLNKDFDELKAQTKTIIDDELNKRIVENSAGGLYKRPLIELYLYCGSSSSRKLLYKTERLAGCPMQILCPTIGSFTTSGRPTYLGNINRGYAIVFPLPYAEGSVEDNHARLVINSCDYMPPSSTSPLPPGAIVAMGDKCV